MAINDINHSNNFWQGESVTAQIGTGIANQKAADALRAADAAQQEAALACWNSLETGPPGMRTFSWTDLRR